MSYYESKGIVLRRRDRFETDQFLRLFTPDRGVLSVRVPHGQKSQKTYCGRIEPPNEIVTRLYQSREDGPWTLSDSSIRAPFSELMGKEDVKKELWPLLSLYNDLFPEGESPGDEYVRFRKGLELLENGVRPAVLVACRLLVKTAIETGIGLRPIPCVDCGTADDSRWYVDPERGWLCSDCGSDRPEEYGLPSSAREAFSWLFRDTWEELGNRTLTRSDLSDLESLLYRLFHYHFEISLDSLRVRQSL